MMIDFEKVNAYLNKVRKFSKGGIVKKDEPIKQTQAERAYNFINPADVFNLFSSLRY